MKTTIATIALIREAERLAVISMPVVPHHRRGFNHATFPFYQHKPLLTHNHYITRDSLTDEVCNGIAEGQPGCSGDFLTYLMVAYRKRSLSQWDALFTKKSRPYNAVAADILNVLDPPWISRYVNGSEEQDLTPGSMASLLLNLVGA